MALDVNEAFAAERAAQIAAAGASAARWDARVKDGKLVPLGGGRFRVNDPGSWDNGEVLLQQAGQILPQTGLDMTTGAAAVYSAVPMWHALGNVVPGGTTDVDEVLKLGGIDFEIEQRPVKYLWAGPGDVRDVPGQFVNVRTDTGGALAVVGKRYVPNQPRSLFRFLQELTGKGDMVWESAGATRGGRRIFVCVRMPDTVVIDPHGIADQIVPFISAIDSNDGTSPFRATASPWRIVCGNTEKFNFRDALSSWSVPHTTNGPDRIREARRTLGLSLRYYERYGEEETLLARTKIKLDQFDAMLADLFPPKEKGKDGKEVTDKTRRSEARRRGQLHGIYEVESQRVGETAYAAERAVTGWLDNVAPRRVAGDKLAAARATALIEDLDTPVKNAAHKRLMLLTNR